MLLRIPVLVGEIIAERFPRTWALFTEGRK